MRHIFANQISLQHRGNNTDILVGGAVVASVSHRIDMDFACEVLEDMDYDINKKNYVLEVMKPEERRYTYQQSSQICGQTGLIGYLRADFGKNGKEFYSTWFPERDDLNTPEFKEEIDMVINSLREKGNFLSDRSNLIRFCHSDPAMYYQNNRSEYGVRINTRGYAYLMKLITMPGNYNLYCYCYKRDWLDMHLAKAARGIRFIDTDYREKFRLADGDYVRIITEGFEPRELECRYIDDSHLEAGDNIYHICEFAEKTENSKVIPLRRSLPEKCYVYIETSNDLGIVNKGEMGYYHTDITALSREEMKEMVDELNEKIGVTKAQAEAMKLGSMFGWSCPAADPKNYDENGIPLMRKTVVRDTAR